MDALAKLASDVQLAVDIFRLVVSIACDVVSWCPPFLVAPGR